MFSKLFSSGNAASLQWNHLNSLDVLDQIDQQSMERPVLIFKHSTRCSISAMALSRFERSYEEDAAFDPYFLDLLTYREVSNEIASRYGVTHESPQAILIAGGKAIHDSSHNGIDFKQIDEIAKNGG